MWLQDELRLGKQATTGHSPRRRRSDRNGNRDGEAPDRPRAQQRPESPGAEQELLDLTERLAELERENAFLRASARMFADLAERLNEELRRLREVH